MKILYKSSAEQQTEILIRQNMAELERQKKKNHSEQESETDIKTLKETENGD